MEQVLRKAGRLEAGRIAALGWQPIGTGQVGDTARFVLTWQGDGAGEAGPASLAGKFASADATSRHTAATMGLYAKEVFFYRTLAPLVAARVPQVHATEIDEAGAEFVLLFEDLGPARGGNQLLGCDIEDARAAVRQAAAIHAPTRNHPAVLGAERLHSPPELLAQIGALYHQAHGVFRERYDGLLSPELMAICERLDGLVEGWLHRQLPDPGLVHGDFRLDNMLFDIGGGAEPIAIVDWQTCAAGCAMNDLGYFMGCGIGSDLRRPYEEELLELYAGEMSRRGVPTSRQGLWNRYCIGALHGVFTAVFSAAFVVRTERGDANFLSMARGACELAADHDAIGALTRYLETGAC
jgi:hypothetical protein